MSKPKASRPQGPSSITIVHEISQSFPKEATMIADIISQWNALEFYCANLLSIFTGMDQYHARFVQGAVVSPKAKIDIMHAAGTYALRVGPNNRRQELDDLCALLTGLINTRNRYAHGVYAAAPHGKLFVLHTRYEWPSHDKSINGITIAALRIELKRFTDTNVKAAKLIADLQKDRLHPDLKALLETLPQ
jgi:hypothetical protein